MRLHLYGIPIFTVVLIFELFGNGRFRSFIKCYPSYPQVTKFIHVETPFRDEWFVGNHSCR